MKFQGFIGPSYTLQSVNIDAQKTVNLIPQMNESGFGKEGAVMSFVGTPGLTLKATVGNGPIRAQHKATNDYLYVVSGANVYKIDTSFNETLLGSISTTGGNVSMADNGSDLFIVDGTAGYTVNLSSDAFATVSDPDFSAADKVVYQDGYFIFNDSGTGQIFISDLNSTGIDSGTASAEGRPDNIISMISDHRDLWLFGSDSIEVFFNSGNADFPFERIEGAFVEHGCAAAFSVAKMNNEVYWLGNDDQGRGVVYKARGYQPERISTHAVEIAIGEYTSISDAVAYTYQEAGHYFYVLNFTDANTTWVYDASTNLWHERAYTNTKTGQLERHRSNNHAFFNGLHIVGDYQDGKLYEQDLDTYSDNGDEITRLRAAPHVSADRKYLFFDQFEIDMEFGVGLDGASTTQGYDPLVVMQFSDDGGASWSSEKNASIGRLGKRDKRVIWRRLGYSRDRVFRIKITEPVKIAIVGAHLKVRPASV